MFTNISSERTYKRIATIVQENSIDATFLYDCGSSTNKILGYRTTEFKKALPSSNYTSLTHKLCKCIGVESEIPIFTTPDERSLFVIPNFNSTMPMAETDAFKYFLRMNDAGLLDNYFDVNSMGFLMSIGYKPGFHQLSAEQNKTLRHIHDFFWSIKLNQKMKLDEFRVSDETPTQQPSRAIKTKKEKNKVSKQPQTAHVPEKGTVEHEISLLTIDGQRLSLPKEKLQHYVKIKQILGKAGGKYKKLGFDFPSTTDLPSLINKLIGGETVNIKKDFQFFATPTQEARHLVQAVNLKSTDRWLEPSAGQGAIAELARKISNNGVLVELMDENIAVLQEKGFDTLLQKDFLDCTKDELGGGFDAIIANPPFTKNLDIKHFVHMVDMLNDDGRIACIMSSHWTHSSTKLCKAFKAWLVECNASVTTIEAGAFSESGTQVQTQRVVLNKREILTDFDTFLTQYQAEKAA